MNDATLNLLKLLLLLLAGILLTLKALRVLRFNRQSDEPIPLQVLLRYSSTEIDGSYSNARKHMLHHCNRLTYLAYLCLVLSAILFMLPGIAARLGLLS